MSDAPDPEGAEGAESAGDAAHAAVERALEALPEPRRTELIVWLADVVSDAAARRREVARPRALSGLDLALARDGFHRVGRVDEVGRRSLWLREERDAIELRAGREGDDARVRVTRVDPLYYELQDVMSAARFAAEWESADGCALEEGFAVDRCPDSVHRQCADPPKSEPASGPESDPGRPE